MARTNQMRTRAVRVLNILESINDAIGRSGAIQFMEAHDLDETTRLVPLGLRQGIAFTAVRMLDEASKGHRAKVKAAYEAYKASLPPGEKPMPRKAFEMQGKSPEAIERRNKREKKAAAAYRAKKKAKKAERGAPRGGTVPGGRRPPPPPPFVPPAGGAGGAIPVEPRKKRKIAGAALRSAFKKRRREARPERQEAPPVGGGVAALRRAGEELKQAVGRGRGKRTLARPGVPVGERRPMRQPKHGEIPSEFAAAQRQKGGELDWLEKERQRRSGIVKKSGKLARMRGRHHLLRDREHDVAKGYHIDPTTGERVHSGGGRENKKFANATTFRDSDDDAMLHTDKSRKGSRASADDSEFVFKGDTGEDPRNKWYRVSKEGGYASAMASLGKAYHKSPKMRAKVIQKVKSTGFVGADGSQINVRPTGAIHDERGACVKKKDGNLTALGAHLKKHNPEEFYRLCKGSHDGPGGTKKGRIEYDRGFDPQHDDASKVNRLHKAAEAGKEEEPRMNILRHTIARQIRGPSIHRAVRSIGRHAGD